MAFKSGGSKEPFPLTGVPTIFQFAVPSTENTFDSDPILSLLITKEQEIENFLFFN